MRSVGVMVVMNDVVRGVWVTEIRRLSALWSELCSLQDGVILENNTHATLPKKNQLCVPHLFGVLFCKHYHECVFCVLAHGMMSL